ncbi:uncharacterized protein LOC124479890 isoform X2 [Hypomesus transpacificus]|uniref:uncharacterized protein LOC124479890 isoform X2 n=1 Tax=Hypomesus transpacificus TaxID=137520 RepID=UPI001F07692A|nr:uncharacterized protein LOC124479890 isoform X2 [Hypomesus transpacificus]
MGEGKSNLSPLSHLAVPLSLSRTVKVILNMSVTVDYGQLPKGKMAVTHMLTSHPDVHISHNPPEELCTLTGRYSEIQAAVAQLLGLSGDRGTTDTSSAASNGAEEGHASPHTGRTSQTRDTTQTRAEQPLSAGAQGLGSYEELGSGVYGWEAVGQTEDGAVGLQPEPQTMVDEDFSLIMDADLFLYLQRHCGEEYRHILSSYGVEAVDVSAQGLTTLFLQNGTGTGKPGGELERLRGARGDLSQLYQENEARLRRAQLPKSILPPRGGLQTTIEALQVSLPKLLLSEDDRNIFIVGSGSDVSEAKQILLLGQREQEYATDDVASLLRSPPPTSYSSKPGKEAKPYHVLTSSGFLDPRVDKMLKSYEVERKAEGARGYKLAARFKDLGVAGLGGLGAKPGGTVAAGSSGLSTRPGLRPMQTHEHLSSIEKPSLGGEGFSSAGAQNIEEDLSFKNGSPLFNYSTRERKSASSLLSIGTRQGSDVAPLATTQSNLAEIATFPTPGSGSSLRRASSFSGRSRPKDPDTGQSKTAEETGKSMARSNSFSNRTGRDRRGVYTAQVPVSTVMWRYIKEVYAIRLDDITSDLQMADNQLEKSCDVTVTLKGAESSIVKSCELELRKLVAMVTTDFSVQELRLAELGVSNPHDETLNECCAEIRGRFKKVSIQVLKESVFLIGPRLLCSQVSAALREVFSGVQGPGQETVDLCAASTSSVNQPTPLQMNGDPNPTPSQNNTLQLKTDYDRVERGEATGGSLEKNFKRKDSTKTQRKTETEPKNGVVSSLSTRKDPVTREKVKRRETVDTDGNQTDTLTSHSVRGKDRGQAPVMGSGTASDSVSTQTSQGIETPPKDHNLPSQLPQTKERLSRTENQEGSGGSITQHSSRRSSLPGAQGGMCVCGKSGASLKMTECRSTLCPECLANVHIHCRVCPKVKETPRGIQGKMSCSEMSLSLPGHNRHSTMKISYYIPDGIQGEDHPSPGSTFRGGLFEAFLPLCERTHSLLPRLERAFKLGLTFTVTSTKTGPRVTWDCIPHKTSLQGGKSGNGYPDSNYLTRLSEALAAVGIEQVPAKSQNTNQI